jgi:hypothetical protein
MRIAVSRKLDPGNPKPPRAQAREKPDTKAGQIWALWPEIKAALDDGQSFKSICHWLQQDAEIAVSA